MTIIAILLSVLLFGFSAVVPESSSSGSALIAATPEPVTASGYAHPEWLVDPAWLYAHATDERLRIVALTPADAFANGHVPAAAQIDWPDLAIVDTSDPSIARWQGEVEGKLTTLGITSSDTVVIYDDGSLFAARLWWVLDQLGHADKRILNGGLAAWTGAGGALETGPSRIAPAAEPYRGHPNTASLASLETVKASLNDPDVVRVDARSAQEYRDGYIPGAVNIEFTTNAAANPPKLWKSAAELRALYTAAGVTPDKRVIPYCATGVRSAVTYFTLRLIGYEHVALYTGSWKEWSGHPELPKTTGR